MMPRLRASRIIVEEVLPPVILLPVQLRNEFQVHHTFSDLLFDYLRIHLGVVQSHVPLGESRAWQRTHKPCRIEIVNKSAGLSPIHLQREVPRSTVLLVRA